MTRRAPPGLPADFPWATRTQPARPALSTPPPVAPAPKPAPAGGAGAVRRTAAPPAPRVQGLTGLGTLRETLRRHAELRAAELARQNAARARQQAESGRDRTLLRQELSDVDPLPPYDRHVHEAPRPLPVAAQHRADEEEALRSSLSDGVDLIQMLEADESLSFRHPTVGYDVLRKLRRGQWVTRSQLDLHGLRTDEAREAIGPYLSLAVRNGHRCVRIIHGKGLGSIERTPVLKGKVVRWLTQRQEVLAFCEAPPHAGGAGALLVLLRNTSGR